MDRYEVGNFVRRWASFVDSGGRPVDPFNAVCQVIDPIGRSHLYANGGGNVRRLDRGSYCWDMIASRAGQWTIRWLPIGSLKVLPEGQECFEVVENLSVKRFATLIDRDLTLVPLAPEHLELVRCWRNRDDTRRWFFNSAVISEADQRAWYYSTYLPDRSDFMWIAHLDGLAIGTGALTHVDLVRREGEWARLMIGEDVARGKGLAQRIARLVRDYGLDVLGLERIYGSLYTANEITMYIDMQAGYMPYAVEGDITHVELWRKDWRP